MDTISPEKRSRVMARVRSVRNQSTEWRIRSALIRAGVRGWKMNSGTVHGRPDFAFPEERLAVFVDGCFWHGCPKCKRTPSSNTDYWNAKIQRNRKRDRKVSAALRKEGWRVLRLWEHDISRSVNPLIKRLLEALEPPAHPENN